MNFSTVLGKGTVVLGIAWAMMSRAYGVQASVVCPSEIARQSVQVRAPVGWTAFVPFEYTQGVPLTGAGVMYGPPSKMAISKPDAGGANTEVWKDIRAPADGVWMACFYGDDGRQDIILAQRLENSTRECAVNYKRNTPKRIELDIRCH